ncbi:MAG: hypothetical protein ACRC1W_17795, partial [Shewanella sp.]
MPTYGMCRADGVSSYLKVFIKQGDVTVVGYIGDGASKQLSSMWQSPFEGDTVGQAGGGAYDKAADIAQVKTGATTKTMMNTAMVWEGISPHEITLPIYLKAFENAKEEVNDAIMHLEMMASPQLSEDWVGLGSIPQTCEVNIGRRLILPRCQIKDVSSELDAPKDR